MCKIPHLGQRLDLLLTIRELPVSMRDLEPVSNTIYSVFVTKIYWLDGRGPSGLNADFRLV